MLCIAELVTTSVKAIADLSTFIAFFGHSVTRYSQRFSHCAHFPEGNNYLSKVLFGGFYYTEYLHHYMHYLNCFPEISVSATLDAFSLEIELKAR